MLMKKISFLGVKRKFFGEKFWWKKLYVKKVLVGKSLFVKKSLWLKFSHNLIL